MLCYREKARWPRFLLTVSHGFQVLPLLAPHTSPVWVECRVHAVPYDPGIFQPTSEKLTLADCIICHRLSQPAKDTPEHLCRTPRASLPDLAQPLLTPSRIEPLRGLCPLDLVQLSPDGLCA